MTLRHFERAHYNSCASAAHTTHVREARGISSVRRWPSCAPDACVYMHALAPEQKTWFLSSRSISGIFDNSFLHIIIYREFECVYSVTTDGIHSIKRFYVRLLKFNIWIQCGRRTRLSIYIPTGAAKLDACLEAAKFVPIIHYVAAPQRKTWVLQSFFALISADILFNSKTALYTHTYSIL